MLAVTKRIRQMMDWNSLLSTKRFGMEDRPTDREDARTQFQRDYDRIIFSSPFRRLQNKTQVFPLPGSIFVHNRLTHSLEVASVGRSLGTIVAKKLEKQGIEAELLPEIGAAVGAACLAHDLGNPPFGHSGEKAISRYFTHGKGQALKEMMSREEWTDIVKFEGNANALRVLTHQYHGRREGGFALTHTVLATIVKYPCQSTAGFDKSKVYRKKYGFFQSEKESFERIAAGTGLIIFGNEPFIAYRHPLVFLVEAADDICYQIIDLEDAQRLGIISMKDTIGYFRGFYEDDQKEIDKINNTLAVVTDENEQIAFLRAKVINKLIMETADIFVRHHEEIMAGQFDKSLVDMLQGTSKAAMDRIIEFSWKEIYNHRSVVKIELAGYNVLGGLLEELVDASLNQESHYAKKLMHLVPQQFTPKENTTYAKVQAIVDFVAGMTDIYAVDLYRQIKGISISYA